MEESYDRARVMFYSWATAWIHERNNLTGADTNVPEVPDVPDLLRLLRCLGFKLRHSSTCSSEDVTPIGSLDSALSRGCRVVLTCDRSGQRFILEGTVGDCSCPPRELENTWHVSARVPTGSLEQLHSLDTAGSSSIRPVDLGMSKMTHQVVGHLMKLLRESCELAPVSDATSIGSPLRCRSLDTLIPGSLYPVPRLLSETRDVTEAMDTSSDCGAKQAATVQCESSPGLMRQRTWTCGANTLHHPRSTDEVLVGSLTSLNVASRHINNTIASLKSIQTAMVDPSAISAIDINDQNQNTPKNMETTMTSENQLAHGSAPSLLEGKGRRLAGTPRRALNNITAFMKREKVKTPSKLPTSLTPSASSSSSKKRPHNQDSPFVKPAKMAPSSYPRPAALGRTTSYVADKSPGGKIPVPVTPRLMQKSNSSRVLPSAALKANVQSKIGSIRKPNTPAKE